MLCNTVSHYPDGIDEMLFFQDNDLETIEIMNRYHHLIAQGRYTEANECINAHDNIYGYFADLFNTIENRIYNLQQYLTKDKPPKKKLFVYTKDHNTEPDISLLENNIIWC